MVVLFVIAGQGSSGNLWNILQQTFGSGGEQVDTTRGYICDV
jgi:hypothetical protein